MSCVRIEHIDPPVGYRLIVRVQQRLEGDPPHWIDTEVTELLCMTEPQSFALDATRRLILEEITEPLPSG